MFMTFVNLGQKGTVADVVTVTLVNMSGGSLELDPAMLSVLVTRFSA